MTETRLPNNTLAFIALANEYCALLEGAADTGRDTLVASLLRLLPRIYISASDLVADEATDPYVAAALDEAHYDTVRRNVEVILGADDTYLDAALDDMQYSDTPIAVSVSEQAADLFQALYNFIEAVRDSTDDVIADAVASISEDFDSYLSDTICSLLRAVNRLR